ncbi:hypothetical protein FQN50_009621 [Emmonsiellopsis sp. PD_5]|nr:hypothetical protein FQN50_009621 [Emmonsiellopsis sp. PD_5]
MSSMLARRGRVAFQYVKSTSSARARIAHSSPEGFGAVVDSFRNLSLSSNSHLAYCLPTISRKTYATAGRPKAHTGRAAASKKPSSAKPSKAKATKAKAKPAEKKAVKAKPKTPKRKVPTEKQKEALAKKKARDELKQLKIAALTPPKRLPVSVYMLVPTEAGDFGGQSAAYKNLDPAERQRLSDVAHSNHAANRSAYEEWVKSHTPLEIKQANAARRKLRHLVGKPKAYADIPDSRQVKQSRSAYILYVKEQLSGGGDYLEIRKKMSKAAQTWKTLSDHEREKYIQLAARDQQRYIEEHKSLYGEAPPRVESSVSE